MTDTGFDLRSLVEEAVREVVKEMMVQPSSGLGKVPPSAATHLTSDTAPRPDPPAPEHLTLSSVRPARVERVRIADDAHLNAFARHLLTLFENPKNRQDLRAGRLRFSLDGTPTAGSPTGPAVRVDRGAVTERHVMGAHEAGKRIILGRRAVLTPLGREKARALQVSIEKER